MTRCGVGFGEYVIIHIAVEVETMTADDIMSRSYVEDERDQYGALRDALSRSNSDRDELVNGNEE